MPRKRNSENKGLPTGWRFLHGAYYYSVPKGQESAWDEKRLFKLGKTLPESYREWTRRIEYQHEVKTIGQLLDRYALEIVPRKSVSSRETNGLFIKQLRTVFGQMRLTDLKPKHCYLYIEKRRVKVKDEQTGKTRGGLTVAQREIEILSHAFTQAVMWGMLDKHPFKGQLEIKGDKPRDRYVADWEIAECMKLTTQRKKGSFLAVQAYIQLKIITGMDRGDLLRLKMSDIKTDGLHNQRHKTKNSSGKRTIYQWTPVLKAAIERAKEVRPVLSPWLFCKRNGECYYDESTGRADGWDSMWQRFMEKLLKETLVNEPFTEHDLRAKAGSDAPTLDRARGLLAHADPRTTDRIYRRKPELVTPLEGIKDDAESYKSG